MSNLLSNLSAIPNPCFVLDESLFENNMKVLNKVQQESGASVLCALKGFAMWEVFPLMRKYISGGTASSLHEAKLIVDEMKCKAHSCFVVYDESEFDEVQELSSHITFNSLSQFEKFKHKLKPDIKYALRINPEFSNVEFEQYNPCMPGSRFGIVKGLLPEILPQEISGLHFHTLCESSAEEFEKTLERIEKEFGSYLEQVSWLNFGGGHHVTRPRYNVDLLSSLLKRIKEQYKVQVIIEPGEAIGLNTGFLTSKVEDVVSANGINTVMLNVSFAAHMPDCLEMPYKPRVVGESKEGFACVLGGNTCMSGDFVGGFNFSEKPKVGDQIIFEDMAHYTFVKTNFFNGVKHPALGIWKKEGGFKLLREYGYDDFKIRLS